MVAPLHPLQAIPLDAANAPRSSATHFIEQAYAAAGRGDPDTERVAWMMALGHAPMHMRGAIAARIEHLTRSGLNPEDEAALARFGPSQLPVLVLSVATAVGSALLYSLVYGDEFAGGFVIGMYVHELGHVAALRRLGLPLSAPIFVPFVGATVRMRQRPRRACDEAQIALAGPLWGLSFSALCVLVHRAGGPAVFGMLGLIHAWINLLNLLPVGPLDGGRAFKVLSHRQRLVAAVGLSALAIVFTQVTPAVLAAVTLGVTRRAPEQPAGHPATLAQYLAIAAGLVIISAWSG